MKRSWIIFGIVASASIVGAAGCASPTEVDETPVDERATTSLTNSGEVDSKFVVWSATCPRAVGSYGTYTSGNTRYNDGPAPTAAQCKDWCTTSCSKSNSLLTLANSIGVFVCSCL